MVERSEISTCKTPVELVDAAAFVTEWWENSEGRRLPGEEGGYTVYGIEFWDGCRFFDYTQGSVFERVSELGFGPVEVWRNNFLSEHGRVMAYVVRCVASYLAVTDASECVMGDSFGINGVPYRFAFIYLVARDRWRDDDARLLPGEEGRTTVYQIEVRDGCQYFGYTRGGVFGWLIDTAVVSKVVAGFARGQFELEKCPIRRDSNCHPRVR